MSEKNPLFQAEKTDVTLLTAARGGDRAAEEEREDWAELLRRLDRWIESLRGAEDREEDGRRPTEKIQNVL